MITWSWLYAIWTILAAIFLAVMGYKSYALWMFGVSILGISFHVLVCALKLFAEIKAG